MHFTVTKVPPGIHKEPLVSRSYALPNKESHQAHYSLTVREPSNTFTGLHTHMGTAGTIKMFYRC